MTASVHCVQPCEAMELSGVANMNWHSTYPSDLGADTSVFRRTSSAPEDCRTRTKACGSTRSKSTYVRGIDALSLLDSKPRSCHVSEDVKRKISAGFEHLDLCSPCLIDEVSKWLKVDVKVRCFHSETSPTLVTCLRKWCQLKSSFRRRKPKSRPGVRMMMGN